MTGKARLGESEEVGKEDSSKDNGSNDCGRTVQAAEKRRTVSR